ncbi:unnamed protein product [Victoria cruziana]
MNRRQRCFCGATMRASGQLCSSLFFRRIHAIRKMVERKRPGSRREDKKGVHGNRVSLVDSLDATGPSSGFSAGYSTGFLTAAIRYRTVGFSSSQRTLSIFSRSYLLI